MAYFAVHALIGRNGFEARTGLLERATVLKAERLRLETVRDQLAADVVALSPDHPSADIVYEFAGDLFGLAPPGTILIRPQKEAQRR
ncbi:MAG: hypothetical protein AAFR04_02525 [Pseudomonadota bacterium]